MKARMVYKLRTGGEGSTEFTDIRTAGGGASRTVTVDLRNGDGEAVRLIVDREDLRKAIDWRELMG